MTSFNIAAACVTELNWCDCCAEVEIQRTDGEEMSVADLQELEEMAAKLEATARKLPQGSSRGDLLREIARFRAKLAALQARSFNGNQGEWLKAKGK